MKKNTNWFLVVTWMLFIPIIFGAVFVSAQHTYEVLTILTGVQHWIAVGAAAVIDMALVLLGTLSAYYTTKRYDTTQLTVATWGLIVATVGVNFIHGYMSGDVVGGVVAMLYPAVAAIIYHFIIDLATKDTNVANGRVLVAKAYVPRSVSRKERKELETMRAQYHYNSEKDKYEQLNAQLGAWRQAQPTRLQAEATVPTQNAYKPTTYDYSLPTADTDVSIEEPTSLQLPTQVDTVPTATAYKATEDVGSVVTQVETVLDGVDINVASPDYLDTSMSIQEMCSLLVANGVVDNPTAYTYINALTDYEVPKKTVQTSMKRARDKISQ